MDSIEDWNRKSGAEALPVKFAEINSSARP